MKEQIATGTNPTIRVESCKGDLIVRGWGEAAMQIKGQYELQESDKGYVLSSDGELRLTVPEETMLIIGRVEGELSLKRIAGTTVAEEIRGDVLLSGVGDIEIARVHGDLTARKVNGSLTLDQIHGDALIRHVEGVVLRSVYGDLSARGVNGSFSVDTVSGDADLRGVDGDLFVGQGHRDVNVAGVSGQVQVAGVIGDIRLRSGLSRGEHTLDAKGDIVVRWPIMTPLSLVAEGRQISNRLPLMDAAQENGRLTGRIGEGECRLVVRAGGRVILKEYDPTGDAGWTILDEEAAAIGIDMAGVAARIEAELSNHLARFTRDLETRFGPDFGRQLGDRIARKAEKAAERSRRRATGFDFAAAPSAPARKPTSTEEQLRILKMVETGKITPEEAGMLLEALEA